MKFIHTLFLIAQLGVAWTAPTELEERKKAPQTYKLRADAPGTPFDGQFLQIDPLFNDIATLRFFGSGVDLEVSIAPGSSSGTYALSVAAPLAAATAEVVLSGGYYPYWKGITVLTQTALADYSSTQIMYGQWTITPPFGAKKSKPKDGKQYLGYSTLPTLGWYAYSPDGGGSYYVAFYDPAGGPAPIPEGQTLIPFKLEVVET